MVMVHSWNVFIEVEVVALNLSDKRTPNNQY